jgi:hypothetical protein
MLLNFLLAIVYRYINIGSPFIHWSELPGFYTQGWPIMVQTFVILYLVYFSIRHFSRRYKENPNGIERFVREILFILLAGFAIMEFFRWVFVTYMVVPEDDMAFLDRKLKMILMIDITFLIVIYSFMTSFRIFRFLQLKNLEVVKWQREYTQSQFEAMKNQLNPHFLFNSLNALSSLVYVNADLAETFIEKLSRSYRYLLEQRDKTTVPLAQELQFLDSFLFLTEQRFGNKLQVSLQEINAANCYVPPHTLMILLEYIIQTNSMSAASPLVLSLSQKENVLVLEYNEQLKPGNTPEETGSQLSRLKDEFQYLLGKPLAKNIAGNHITITIPLLLK